MRSDGMSREPLTIDEFYASGKPTTVEMLFLDRWFTYAPTDTPEPVCQYYYVTGRKFHVDFAWLGSPLTVLVEADGGIFNHKAHGSVSGIMNDIVRANLAAAHWCLMFRCHPGSNRKCGALNNADMAREFVEMVARAVAANC